MRVPFLVWGKGWGGLLDIALKQWYNNAMETVEKLQKMSVYFPLELLERVRASAKIHKRSFNKETLWLIEQGLEKEQKERRK